MNPVEKLFNVRKEARIPRVAAVPDKTVDSVKVPLRVGSQTGQRSTRVTLCGKKHFAVVHFPQNILYL